MGEASHDDQDRQEHRLPLAAEAIALLTGLRAQASDKARYVFLVTLPSGRGLQSGIHGIASARRPGSMASPSTTRGTAMRAFS